jgi:prepilin-type N-terminal cleavage/methylation domain-containing protein
MGIQGYLFYASDRITEETMIREILNKQSGFSLIELIITMTVFVIAIAVATSIYVPMLTQFKQQSKVSETQVERLVGLDILRRDLEQAGYGLPWVIPDSVTAPDYQETVADPKTLWVERNYNDGPPAGPNTPVRGSGADIEMPGNPNPPGAIRNGNNDNGFPGFPLGTLNKSDVLVIKSTNIAINDAATKWTYVTGLPNGNHEVNMWGSSVEDLNDGERAIVLIPMRGETNQRILVNDAGDYSLQFNSGGLPNEFAPSTQRDVFLIYGIDPDTDLRMPFNRADYYVERPPGPAPDDMPPRCAQNTGILYKGVVNQTDGNKTEIRLLECVADMQLAFGLDGDGDGDFDPLGGSDFWTEYVNDLTAEEIREQLKEVRVYILAHEGQRDTGYNFSGFNGGCGTCMMVGEVGIGGEDFDLSIIPDYLDYRWKVYTVVVKPANLQGS